MSIPDPGGTFTTGPSTLGTVLNEPTPVAANNPDAPVPQTGNLTAYVDASAQTQQQKEQLLSSIAQLGSAGKQAYVQQQNQTNQTRLGAISSVLGATGQSANAGPVTSALQAAFANQQTSQAGQQNSLQNYQNTIGQASNDWYNQINAAIPIMQERTSQQVNSYYAAQRLAAQQEASQVAVANADEAAANSRAQEANTAQGTAQIAQGTAQINQDIAAQKYGQAGGAQVDAANKAIGSTVNTFPGFTPGTAGNTALWGILGTTDPTSGKVLTQAQVQAYINQLYASNSPLVKGVNRTYLSGFVNSYFQGSPLPVYSASSSAPPVGIISPAIRNSPAFLPPGQSGTPPAAPPFSPPGVPPGGWGPNGPPSVFQGAFNPAAGSS